MTKYKLNIEYKECKVVWVKNNTIGILYKDNNEEYGIHFSIDKVDDIKANQKIKIKTEGKFGTKNFKIISYEK